MADPWLNQPAYSQYIMPTDGSLTAGGWSDVTGQPTMPTGGDISNTDTGWQSAGMNWGQALPTALKDAAAAAKDLNTSKAAPTPDSARMTPEGPRQKISLADLVALLQKRDAQYFPAFNSSGQPVPPMRTSGGLLGF